MRPRQITRFGWSAEDDMRADALAAGRAVLVPVNESGAEDVMAQAWHCLSCARRFRWGQARMDRGAIRCPECGDTDLARAGTPGLATL